LLPRTLAEICENVRDFVVLEDEGQIIGCGALHLYGTHLAEIRSITVNPRTQKRGGGSLLMKALMAEAKRHRVDCICLFTRAPEFFARQGFFMARREYLPDKIYKDCHVCPRYFNCDEVAMVRGKLPSFAILPEPANWLVKLQVTG
jgi:amino-acid N-acetyltransferase